MARQRRADVATDLQVRPSADVAADLQVRASADVATDLQVRASAALPHDVERELRGEGLTLEPLLPAHTKALYSGLRDERVYAFTPNRRPASPAVLEKRFGLLRHRRDPEGGDLWLNWAVRLDDGTYVGWVQATVSDDRSADIGYIIFPQYWRRGYARTAIRPMLEYLRSSCEVKLAIAHVDAENQASIGLLERLGFERVATGPADDMEGRLEHRYESAL